MKKRIFAAALSLALALSAAAPAAALELEDAKALLKEYYIEPIPESVLELDSLDAILEALNDPYTTYLTEEAYQAFTSSVDGQKLVGIGLSAETVFNDGYLILSVLPNSPALENGLQPGERLIAVDGVALSPEISPNMLIAGEEGTSVTVTVQGTNGKLRDETMVRRTVQIPIVTYQQVDQAGVIDCSSFGESTGPTVREAVSTLNEKVNAWIVDLRANPGGTSTAASESAGVFFGSGVTVYFRDAAGRYSYEYLTAASQDLTDKPLIILTSPHSASGSELFSGAVRDYAVGIAVGQRTFGKGVAQYAFDKSTHPHLFNGDAMKISASRFFSPIGTGNHIVGILPTLMVSPENTAAVAQLLTAHPTHSNFGYLKLELSGQVFYIKISEARQSREAFTELLEALPPDALLYKETYSPNKWSLTTPEKVAAEQGLTYQPRTFSDLEQAEYAREIRTLATYGLLAGYEGNFSPDHTLTRAELCTILASALNLPAASNIPFTDVSPDAWYADAVAAMAHYNFVAGTDQNTFCPDAQVTHNELVTILSAIAVWLNMNAYAMNQEDVRAEDWVEVYYYPDWAQTAARNLKSMGLPLELEAPDATVTRDFAAGMICRLLEYINVIWNGKDLT